MMMKKKEWQERGDDGRSSFWHWAASWIVMTSHEIEAGWEELSAGWGQAGARLGPGADVQSMSLFLGSSSFLCVKYVLTLYLYFLVHLINLYSSFKAHIEYCFFSLICISFLYLSSLPTIMAIHFYSLP